MNVVLFGATGMVGQGVLRECLLASDVQAVVSVGRNATGQSNPKLREIVRPDLLGAAYTLTRPLWPVLYKVFPQFVTTTERLGRGMLQIARHGAPKPILEARDINALTASDA